MTLRPRSAGVASSEKCNPYGYQWREGGLAVLLVAAVALVYSPAYYGGLIFDDNEQITKPALQTLSGLWRIWFEPGATQQYFPLVHTAFWLEHRWWGDAVFGYHIINLFWHSGAALLLVWVCRKLGIVGGWWAAFVFALHPVCVESVAWIAEQKNGISTVLYLAAVGWYLTFDRNRRASAYTIASLFFALAVLSKTSTVVLPLVLPVIVWWRRGKLELKRDLLPFLPWYALSVTVGLITIWVERKLIALSEVQVGLSLLEKAILAGRIICFYLGKLFWPVDLTLMYSRWSLDPTVGWYYLYSLFVGLMIALLVALVPKSRGPLAACLIFIFSLVPVLGFFDIEWFVFGYVADHFQYLALLGIVVPIVSFATTYVARRGVVVRSLGLVGATALLLLFGVLSFRQSKLYKDAETRYRATLVYSPGLYVAHNNLGTALLGRAGGLPEAIEHFKTAVTLKPDYVEAHNNLANAYALSGSLDAAIEEYQAALRIDPRLASIHANRANILLKIRGRELEGIREYETALKLQPDFPEASNALGAATLNDPARLLSAIRHLRAAIKSRPDFFEAHLNLGNALLNTGAFDREAIEEYQTSLKLNPNFPEAHFNLGVALVRMNRLDDAIRHLKTAASLKPDWPAPRQVLQKLGIKN